MSSRGLLGILRTMLQHVKSMQSIPLSKYLCSKCGSILRETAEDIEINSVNEDCPHCGITLAPNLIQQAKDLKSLQQLPRLQTAYDLYRFSFGIEKLDSILRLGTAGSLCIMGYKANMMLSRICVRALLPARFGGLDSPHVMVVDAGNKSDLYQTVNFARQYRMNINDALDRIIVSRPFTIHQLKKLITAQVPKDVQKYQLKVILIPGLFDLFDDPNVKKKEAKRLIERIVKSVQTLSERILVVTSIHEGKYAALATVSFEKRLILKRAQNNRISIALSKKQSLTITERELKVVKLC
jgi:DNA-directed RNA polymerase subunit RPC12/RpoP